MVQLFQAMILGQSLSKARGKKVYVVSLAQNQKDLFFMKELLESGKVVPVIDGFYPLDKAAEAFRYFETVHPKGKVVITIG